MLTKDLDRTEETSQHPRGPVRIGDLLLQRGLITQEQIDQALAYQRSSDHKKLIGEILVELKFVTEEQVMTELAGTYDIPFARLSPKIVVLP